MGNPNYDVSIIVRCSPRSKRMRKGEDIQKALAIKILETLESLKPVLKRQKIAVVVYRL